MRYYDNRTTNYGGIGTGFLGLLTIAFIVLKLTGVISWSWWLVLLPLYGPFLLVLTVLLIAGIGALIVSLFKRKK